MAFWALAAFSQAASFDCAKAATPAEKLVCSNPTLSRLDDMLATAYRAAEQSSNAAPDLLQQQRRWMRQRATCQSLVCLETVYERRILELDSADCLRDLGSGECPGSMNRNRLPRTADGRLMLLTHRECRIGFDGGVQTKNHAEAIQIHADCIEANVYDPCEDAGGRWGQAQCAWAHLEVSKRRISKVETEIRLLFRGQAGEAAVSRVLEQSGKNWQAQTDAVCTERDSRWPPVEATVPDAGSWGVTEPPVKPEGEAEAWGYCLKRLTAERADELEPWLNRLKTSKGSVASVQAFLRYLSGPRAK